MNHAQVAEPLTFSSSVINSYTATDVCATIAAGTDHIQPRQEKMTLPHWWWVARYAERLTDVS